MTPPPVSDPKDRPLGAATGGKTGGGVTLADDQMCFGCGSRNLQGLHLTFNLDRDRQRITTRWTPAKVHQGYTDIVHGGMTALVLDELMGNLLWKLDLPAVTAELTVRYHRPARVHHPLFCEAWVIGRPPGRQSRVIHMEAVAKSGHGMLVASASARCVRTPA